MGKVIRDEHINTKTKIKIYNATVENIMLYGAEVYADEDGDEIDKAERHFFKKLFNLPTYTPNHFLTTELGIKKLTNIRAKERGITYRKRVAKMENWRLPKIIYEELQQIGIEGDIHTYEQESKRIAAQQWEENPKRAAGLTENVSARLLYQTLEHCKGPKRLFEMKTREAGTVLKARLELLRLGFQPHIRNEDHCTRCGMKGREDTVHFLGKCKRLEAERKFVFGRTNINLEELRWILNCEEMWSRLTYFVEITTDAR